MLLYRLKIFILNIIKFRWFTRILDYFKFIAQWLKFRRINDGRFTVGAMDLYPCLDDRTKTTGFDRHYTYHPAWATRIVAEIKPKVHVDISSILAFSTQLSAFIPVKFYDYRPAEITLSGMESEHADLTNLHFESNSIESLSCMHTIEHVGLSRYGDPMDPKGDLKAINELKRVTAPGGSLLFVVPTGGKARIQFNGHRIYTYDQVVEYFQGFELKKFSLITDYKYKDAFIENATAADAAKQLYGCGCYWLIKKSV
jgi:SAM-dependent methyltransferase